MGEKEEEGRKERGWEGRERLMMVELRDRGGEEEEGQKEGSEQEIIFRSGEYGGQSRTGILR